MYEKNYVCVRKRERKCMCLFVIICIHLYICIAGRYFEIAGKYF